MKMPSIQFPHIPRLFSASLFQSVLRWTERATLWGFMIGLVAVNISFSANTSPYKAAYFLPTLVEPFSPTAHIQVASNLWNLGFHKEAKQEILLAADLVKPNDPTVLGESTSPTSLLTIWESQPKQREASYIYWQQVVKEKPDYRDAFIQAGTLAYELGKTDEAVAFIQKAYNLDPNFQPTATLLTKIHK